MAKYPIYRINALLLLLCLVSCNNGGPKLLQSHPEGASLSYKYGYKNHVLMGPGGGGGPMIGSSLDPTDRRRLESETRYRYDTGQVLTVQQIIGMWQAGFSTEKIIHVINRTRSHYYLTPKQRQMLKQHGVPKKVLKAIENVNKDDLEDNVPDQW